MRAHVALAFAAAAAAFLAGCTQAGGDARDGATAACDGLPRPHVLHVQPDATLAEAKPAEPAGVPVPGVTNGFVADTPKPFLSAALAEGMRIEGPVRLLLWLRSNGGAAPIVVGGGPGEGYQVFAQYGTDTALAPGYIVEYGPVVQAPGTVAAFDAPFAETPGGFVADAGERIRLLVTSLVLEQGGTGHDVMVGGETASRIEFTARCIPSQRWEPLDAATHDVRLPGNQGLLSGAVPAVEGLNYARFNLTALDGAGRVTVQLRATSYGEPKDDIDMSLVASDGEVVWNGGSPAVDETMVLHRRNLDAIAALGPPPYHVRVDSYSGVAYEGTLSIVQETAA